MTYLFKRPSNFILKINPDPSDFIFVICDSSNLLIQNISFKMPGVIQYVSLIIDAAKKAGTAIMEIYDSEDFGTRLKGDNSPITRADIAAHKIIAEKLESTGIPILSEEGKSIPYEERRQWENFWLIDPIDGTKEFIKRNGEFTVNIALMHHNKPVLGVVYVPVKEQVYFGGPGIGAYTFIGDEDKKKELKAQEPSPSEIRIATSRSHLNKETQEYVEQLPNATIIGRGSSLKFMLIAEGKADIYPRFGPTMEWDTAASHAILNAMGIEIEKTDNKGVLEYNKKDLKNPNFIVKR